MLRSSLLLAACVGSAAPVTAAVLPLKVSANGRFLVDQRGEPFLVVGDTPWSLIVQPSEAEIERYLTDRHARGFNSILVNLIEHKFATNAPRTRAGLDPFTKPGDFSAPNGDYFDFAHRVVSRANELGIVVWLAPAYLGAGGGSEGFFKEMKASGPAAVRAYGRFVGRRFRDLPNVVWVLGGDYAPPAADHWTVTEVAEGILEEDRTHLMTGHASRGISAVAGFGEPAWLSVNTAYCGRNDALQRLAAEYERPTVRPFVLVEAIYEGEHLATPELIRRQAYRSLLAGGCGHFFGNNPLWHFDGPGLFATNVTWQDALDSAGSRDMGRFGAFFAGLPWQSLEPEQGHTLVTAGYGDGPDAALTALTPDRKLAVTYVPSTGTEARVLTVDLSRLAGAATARWYNPTSGAYTPAAGAPLPARGRHDLRTPGENGTRTNDWVLLLDARG